MTELRLELPFPPPQLSPNARVHWREKARVVAAYREGCGWAAKVDGFTQHWRRDELPLKSPVRAAVTFVVPDRRKRDLDNLLAMLKPAWDGLVDAGVLAGDDSERFSVESTEIVVGEPGPLGTKRRGWKRESKVIVVLRSL